MRTELAWEYTNSIIDLVNKHKKQFEVLAAEFDSAARTLHNKYCPETEQDKKEKCLKDFLRTYLELFDEAPLDNITYQEVEFNLPRLRGRMHN